MRGLPPRDVCPRSIPRPSRSAPIATAALVAGLLFASAGCRSDGADAAGRRPDPTATNVLLVTLDTTRADRLGCYGYAAARTPRLDALAASGARFDQAFSPVPITLPSHCSLMTGTYPPEHGVRVNERDGLGAELPTMAALLSSHGYRTGAFVASFVLDSRYGLDRGFDVYDDEMPAGGARAERRADHVTQRALDWLDADPQRSFFCWVHYFDPHSPYEPPPGYTPPGGHPYDGELAFADEHFGRLIDWLDQRRLRERTLVLVVGDHGESLGEHGFQWHALLLYESILRVPLLVSQPGTIPAGTTSGGIVRIPDVLPTVMEMLGHPAPPDASGESFAAALRGGDLPPRTSYGETEYPPTGFGWAPLRSLTTDRWKYIEAPRPELYGRRADPSELRNVIAEHVQVAERLRDELEEFEHTRVRRETRTVRLDEDARRKLQSLGYVGGSDTPATAPAERRDPKDMVAVHYAYQMADAAAARGSFAEAAALLEPAARQSPESFMIRYTLGHVYARLARFAEAREELTAALKLNPADVRALNSMGNVLAGLGRVADAVEHYEQAITLDPTYALPHAALGQIMLSRKNEASTARAIEHLHRAVELQPDLEGARRLLADALAANGQYDAAFQQYERLAETDPRAKVQACNMLVALGRTQEAINRLQALLTTDPRQPLVRESLVAVLRRAKRHADALAVLREGVSLRPDDPLALNALAWALATGPRPDLRDPAEAVRLARRACSATDDREPALLDTLAAALAAAGEFTDAVQTAHRAVDLARDGGNETLATEIAARLALYRNGKAYHEGT